MSQSDNLCAYVLVPDDPDTWGGQEGDECHVREEILNDERDGTKVWACPHTAVEDADLCIFHLPVGEKDNETVMNEFQRVFENAADSSVSTEKS